MLVKHSRNVILGGWLAPNLLALGSGILHATAHPCPNHRQFQLAEHTSHLKESLTHGVCLAFSTINGDAPHNDQAQMLLPDDVNDFAQLLCASGQSADLQGDDGVPRFSHIQEHMEFLFYLGMG